MKTVISDDDVRSKFVEVEVRLLNVPQFGKNFDDGCYHPRVWVHAGYYVNGEHFINGDLTSTVSRFGYSLSWEQEDNVSKFDKGLVGSIHSRPMTILRSERFASTVIYDLIRAKERVIVQQLNQLHLENIGKLLPEC